MNKIMPFGSYTIFQNRATENRIDVFCSLFVLYSPEGDLEQDIQKKIGLCYKSKK